MAIRRNPDGSVTVGILKDEPKEQPKVEAEQPKAEQPKRAAKKAKGRG
jgi:hypothetical protein